ncbi:hypothetical protein SPURM210S_08446 [Streptomyces purpurascens]
MPGLIERYAAGLAAGTDPHSPDRWPPITDRGQPMVEAASLAIALHETRPWIWDRLDDRVRQRIADWLGGFVGAVVNDSNWRLFQVITEEFLASVGAPHSRREIDAGLARLEDWYRGDGWYTDGDGRKFDYYNAWALHLYPVLRPASPGRAPTRVRRRPTGHACGRSSTTTRLFGADVPATRAARSPIASPRPRRCGRVFSPTPLRCRPAAPAASPPAR